MNLTEIRQKYPQYDDMDDAQFASSFHDKFYSDMTEEEFNQKIGMTNTQKGDPFEVPPEELIAGSAPGRFLLGAGRLLSGPFQLGANVGDYAAEKMGMEPIVGKWTNEQLERLKGMKERGMAAQPLEIPYLPDSGGEGMDIIGGVGELATGATALKGIPIAKTVAGRMGQGGAIGAGYGSAAPVDVVDDDFAGQKGRQVGYGAAIGTLIPGGIELGKKGLSVTRNVFDPWFKGGSERVVERTLKDAAGADKQAIIKLLRENKQLPGGRAGTSEVAAPAGRAEFTALQKFSEKSSPTEFNRMAQAENQARVAALRSIGKDKTALEAAKQLRSETTSPLYKAADKSSSMVNVKPVISQIDDLMAKNPNEEAVTGPLLSIRKKLISATTQKRDMSGKFLPSEGLTPRSLSSMSKQIKTMMSKKTPSMQSEYDVGVLNSIKNTLDEQIEAVSPAYKQARTEFAELSKPINQMRTGQYLEEKLVSATGKERAAAYAQALRDAPGTLKKSTGFKRYNELGDVLTPEQISKTEAVRGSLERQALAKELTKSGGDRAAGLLGEQTPTLPQIGMFNPKYSVLRSISNRLAGRVQGESLKIMEEIMQNPQRAAELLERVAVKDRFIISNALLEIERASTIGAAQNIQ